MIAIVEGNYVISDGLEDALFARLFRIVASRQSRIRDLLVGRSHARRGTWVLRQACREARRWQNPHGMFISVNVSGRQLDDPRFADVVIAALTDCGLPPASLVLELTESSLIDTRPQQQGWIQLERLRGYGIRIAIDDFGTGYSSLSYLPQLPTDIVKLDKSLTQDRSDPRIDGSGWAFTAAILEAIASLDRKVIAEGVETPGQAWALTELKCSFAQGYLFSRPVPATDIDQMLNSGAGIAPRQRPR